MKYFVALLLALALAPLAHAADLVIAENKKCAYQIVIPGQGQDEVVDHWLTLAAKLTQAAFAKNGFNVEVVQENAKAPDTPGIYLGATAFAAKHGLQVEQHEDWTYYLKAVGQDLIIAGHDQPVPNNPGKSKNASPALLGTVKGVCDFLREFAGVRFLFLTGDQSLYGKRGAFNEDGSLKLDTRSIAFLPVEKIAVPANLNLKKSPLMRANCDASHENFFNIALNFFPMLSTVMGPDVSWDKTIPTAQFGKSHPEYFALTKEGQRACELKVASDHYMQYCVANQGVQDLMFAAAEKLIASGAKTFLLSTMDGFRLCHCNCDDCNKLFGRKAGTMEEIYARGHSGKLWQAFFNITERIRAKYPDVRVVVLNYQDTPISAEIIKRFPENVIVKIQFASQLDFDKLKGVEFPAGICGFEETFTGFGQAGPYLPERTPEHIAGVVQAMARNHVKWSTRDGALGYVRGMQAPAYYVYGRMMDDPSADWTAIYDEFCTAAFGDVAPQMTQFFDLLHKQIAIYSDFYGVFMPAWSRKYSRSTYHDSKWHVMSMYPPEYCADAEALLCAAEKTTTDPDVKARLHLIRIEFDYIRKLARIFFLQNAWTMHPSQANLTALLDAIDEWHADIERLAGGTGRSNFKPLSDWPEMRPFAGHFYCLAALSSEGYQQQWNKTCLNWDTKAIRAGILTDKHELNVATVAVAPSMDSAAWDAAPEALFKVRNGMPFGNTRTSMKVLRDQDHLYVRIESLGPAKHPEDLYTKAPDADIFSQEYVELGIMPPDAGGKIYRLAVNPVAGSRYDAVLAPGKRNRLTEDAKWNGHWESSTKISLEKGPYNLPDRIWTAWFKLPLSDFRATAPATGETWGFNAGRGRNGQYLSWSDARSVTDSEALGKLVF